jgi:hypothetical protein
LGPTEIFIPSQLLYDYTHRFLLKTREKKCAVCIVQK